MLLHDEKMQFSGRTIFDNVGRLTHQFVRRYSVTFVSTNSSFRSANCPYLSVPSVSALPSIRPLVHLSTSARSSRVTHRTECVRACILIQSIHQSIPLVPESSLSHSLFRFFSLSLILSICLFYPFAVVRFLRALNWILHAASIDLQNDLSRARLTRSPLPRVPGIPRDV